MKKYVLLSITSLFFLLGTSWTFAQTAPEITASTDESMLLQVLERRGSDNETLYLKQLACKRLGTHGTKAAVPKLTEMLADPKTAHYARYALETIPTPEVNAAFRDAVKTLKGALLAGVINSIGVRRDGAAVPVILPLVNDADPDVAASALGCLGYIASEESIRALLEQQPADPTRDYLADAMFEAAQQLRAAGKNDRALALYREIAKRDFTAFRKHAAVYWQIKTLARINLDEAVALWKEQAASSDPKLFEVALKSARELPAGVKMTQAMIDQLGKLAPERKALMVAALGDRTDQESKTLSVPVAAALLPAAKPEDTPVRLAAVKALAKIGNPSVVTALVALANEEAGQSALAKAAKATLTAIAGKEVDAAIIRLMETGNASQKAVAISLIEQRRIVSAFGLLQAAARDTDPALRKVAIDAFAQIATPADLPFFLDLLDANKDPAEVEPLRKTLFSACTRMPKDEAATVVTRRMEKADTVGKLFLIELLKEIGGKKAVETVEAAAWGNDTALQDKATEVLGSWRSPEDNDLIAAVCLKLAKEAPNDTHKRRGLRGYIRLPRQYGSIPENKKLEMVREFSKLAVRKDDKLLVFDVFARNPSPKMLDMTLTYLADPELRERAAEIAVVVAEKLQGKSAKTAEAMKKVQETTQNESLKGRAEVVLQKQK